MVQLDQSQAQMPWAERPDHHSEEHSEQHIGSNGLRTGIVTTAELPASVGRRGSTRYRTSVRNSIAVASGPRSNLPEQAGVTQRNQYPYSERASRMGW